MTVVSFLIIPRDGTAHRGNEPPTVCTRNYHSCSAASLGRSWSAWDTSTSQGRLLSTLLAAIADFERDLIRERTGEGRKRAMAAGIKFGRPRKLSDYQRQEAIKRRADGETLAAISKSYGVSIAMISPAVRLAAAAARLRHIAGTTWSAKC